MTEKRIEHVSVGREDIDVHRMGDPSAPAIVYSHGLPASGEEAAVVLANAVKQGFQVVAPTRPGYGDSTAKTQKTLRDITDDTLRILDHLGIDTVHAVGTSAGAKHALALAHREPGRVTGVSLLSPLTPFENREASLHLPLPTRIAFETARALPIHAHGFVAWLAGMTVVRKARKNPAQEIRNYINILPKADQEVLSQPEVFEAFVAIVRDWSKQGTGHGIFGDVLRAAKPWEFRPEDILHDVQIIHGGLDPVVPLKAARTLTKIPHHDLTVLPEGGHAIYAYPEVSRQVVSRAKKLLG